MTRGDVRQHWHEQMDQAVWALLVALFAANMFAIAGAITDNRGLYALMGVFGVLEAAAAVRVIYCDYKIRRVGRRKNDRAGAEALHLEEHSGD